MDPLDPRLRDALKRAHPGLTDQDIDRSEELRAQSDDLDSVKDRSTIDRLQNELDTLLRTRMPKYQELAATVANTARKEAQQRGRKQPIVIKKK